MKKAIGNSKKTDSRQQATVNRNKATGTGSRKFFTIAYCLLPIACFIA